MSPQQGQRPTLFVVGAGCSQGTFDNSAHRPPVAKEFLTTLTNTYGMGDYQELAKVISHLKRTHERVGLEEIWTCIDLHAKFPDTFPISWSPRGRVVMELKSALIRMYGGSCDELSARILSSDTCTIATVAKEIHAGDTLVSFNYDTIVESVVNRISGVPLRHGRRLEPGTIRFAKPHGSVSWPIGALGHSVTDGPPSLNSVLPKAVMDGEVDPLLLGAVPLKSELIFELHKYYRSSRVFEVVREQWCTVANAVATAARIVVLGYGFPREDAYGRFFFKEGLSMRSEEQSPSIEVFTLDVDVLTSVKELFPGASSICLKGPVTAAGVVN